MRITISGMPGAGKSTVAKLLAKKLDYKYYSIGDMRGKLAQDKGLTIDELNKLGEKEFWTDKEVDEYQKKLGETEDNFIVEGRTGFHFIPNSKKIFLKVDFKVGAERIFKDQRPDEPDYESVETTLNWIKQRMESDKKRYLKWYNIDCWNEENYDTVIDTTGLTPEQVVEKIVEFVKR